MFDEISHDPSAGKPSSKKPVKPVTSTALRTEHLEAATILLKAGVACSLKEGEECENTAIAVERVASDLIGLTTAVAIALNRALKGNDLKGADPAIIKRWCEFYSEDLLPQTKSMVKKTSAKLDAYGLFLPSRMGASVSQEVLQKRLKAVESEPEKEDTTEDEADADGKSVEEEPAEEPASKKETVENEEEEHEVAGKKETEEDEDDEYDYEEEEYYDDEDA
jgi:flagellar biosynthesis GTPase FlhF